MALATAITNSKNMANADIEMATDMKMSDASPSHEKKPMRFARRYFWASSLSRRIIAFNLIALCALLLGMLYMSQFRNNVEADRLEVLRGKAQVYALLLGERALNSADTLDPKAALLKAVFGELPETVNIEVRVFDQDNTPIAGNGSSNMGQTAPVAGSAGKFFNSIVGKLSGSFEPASVGVQPKDANEIAMSLSVRISQNGETTAHSVAQSGARVLLAGQPILLDGAFIGSVVTSTPEGFLDELRRKERNNILRLFALAAGLSIVLSVVLARTIANPIYNLAAAMEAGATSKLRKNDPEKVVIPNMSGRDDEIGHLSSAMRNMTQALYHRIETNEQFAADVAHEIKNPLASLRSAVETLRIAPEGEKRNMLLDVVEHDVRRLDRLVTDISNASRLDSELVKEEEETFDLTRMLGRIVDFHKLEAAEHGIELIYDRPKDIISLDGLEERLAQVFVNLISNAVSFCTQGDAVRLWVRIVDNRVLVVVEDTGEGIPTDSLNKVFKRFYSNRSAENFGNNSGLGLSISKQIVEAHGGVIWAENIYTKGASEDDPLGARFVVGLPV